MEPEARYTLVGASIIALVAAAAFAFVWLSRTGVASDFRFYTIHFQQQSLEGLQVGGDVNMKGIKVGRVESYAIDRSNINRVKVIVRVARRTPVSTNTVAVVARNLVTGIARIDLETPGTPGPELEEVPDGESFPVIAEGTSDIELITRSANSVVIAAEQALSNLNALLAPENRQLVAEAVGGARDLANGLNRRLETLDATARTLGDSARAFQKSSETIAAVVDRLGTEFAPVAGDTRAALQEAQGTLRQMQGTMRDLSAAARRLEQDADALARRTDDVADIGAHEVRATAQQLRTGIELLTRTLDRLQDPRAALLGPGESQLGPGESAR
jgi:phospholipid/cholesterol/gamma-HCH transport system substrate-binding protein